MEPPPPTIELVNHLHSMKAQLSTAWQQARKNNNKDKADLIRVVGDAINDQLAEHELTDKINIHTYLTIETRTRILTKNQSA